MAALNRNLQQLFNTAQKEAKIGIGLMSGTSLDGLDIALCRLQGNGLNTEVSLLNFTTLPYPEQFKQEVKQVFSLKNGGLEKACLLNAYIGRYHAELVLQALKEWNIHPNAVDFIASHGQTIYHAPKSQHQNNKYLSATLQIGDGDHLAVATGILTISDFRQKHVAAGGEGAPLALYGDVILGSKTGENRILLNIGGIANLTFIPANGNYNEVVCTDIGPGNTMIDAACRQYFQQAYDEDAKIALSGTVNYALLNALLDSPFFKLEAPKTTGPEIFNLNYLEKAQIISDTAKLDPADIIATLAEFTAKAITGFIKQNFKQRDLRLFLSGGGARNVYIIRQIKELLPWCIIENVNAIGINPDAKEAVLFAVLGNEALCGEPLQIGTNPAVLMGKFSFQY